MDFNVEARRLQLENLNQFISSAKEKVENVLSSLGWNIEEVLKDNQLITCSLDTSHKVPPKSVDKHITKCALRKEGYDLKEQFLSEPQSGTHTIHIDDHKKIEILSAAHKLVGNFKSGWNGQDPDPKTADRLTSTFSTDERLALYDYAAANTTGPPKLPEFDIVNPKRNDDRPLTYEEKLALERDLKRRKIKYKSIHTSHKNHTEVLREVIESQMDLYKDWLNTNEDHTDASNKKTEDVKRDLEYARSTAVSRNSNISNSSRNVQKKHDEKCNEETVDSRSTSRRTSLDRESDRSNTESLKHRRRRSRSRSFDNYRRHRANHREKYEGKSEYYHHRRDRSPFSRHNRDKHRHTSPRERRRPSKERKHNGYKEYKN